MYIHLYVKYALLMPEFNETSIFPDRYSKNTHIPNFMKIRQVGAEMFHAKEQTDMTKLNNGLSPS